MIEYIFIAFVLFLVFSVLKFKRLEWKIKHIPGPPTIPIFGNGFMYLGKSPEETLKVTERLRNEYGSIFRVFLGPRLAVVLTDPKDVEALLSSQTLIEKAGEYDYIAEWLGTGLLISTGQKWFMRRKVLTPAFHFQILEQFVDVFDKHSRIFVKNMEKFQGQEFDIFPFVALCALDVICETSMGVELHAQTNAESEYVQAVKDVSGIITTRHYNFFMRENWIFRLSPLYWRQKKLLKILHGFTDSVILARRDELTRKAYDVDKLENDVGLKKKQALLDILLKSSINGQPLSNMDIREEVDTFMFEGHDTTASGIAFCLYNLAKHPLAQQNAFVEICNMIGDDFEKSVSLKELSGLNYLELVIKESLRMFPSVPFFGRTIRKDFTLNGKLIPKGTTLGVAANFMGRDPTIFKDPNQFIPERFLAENITKNAFSYVPFSAGPRNCIGQKFAMLEMKSIISKLLMNYELKLAINFEPTLVAEMILRPSNGIMIELTRRKSSLAFREATTI